MNGVDGGNRGGYPQAVGMWRWRWTDLAGLLIGGVGGGDGRRGTGGCWWWARGRVGRRLAMEGCGSYGAGLARFLALPGAKAVFECGAAHGVGERRGGKNDVVDAHLGRRRVGERRGVDLRVVTGVASSCAGYLLERRGAVRARTAALNQLDARDRDPGPEICVNSWSRCARGEGEGRWLGCGRGQAAPPNVLRRSLVASSTRHRDPARSISNSVAWSPVSRPNLLGECGVGRRLRGATARLQRRTRGGWQAKHPSPRSPAPPRSTHPAESSNATGSTAAATTSSTGRCT